MKTFKNFIVRGKEMSRREILLLSLIKNVKKFQQDIVIGYGGRLADNSDPDDDR